MINVELAHNIVVEHAVDIGSEIINIEQLEGRVLAQSIVSSRQQPPFDRVAMDGIAVVYSQINNKNFKIDGIQRAGQAALSLTSNNLCIEVMTGAVLPIGTDTVIPYEWCEIHEDVATILSGVEIKHRQNIHFQGSDYGKGTLLLKAGLKLNSTSISIIASQGLEKIKVKKLPKIALISTGDELINPGNNCELWQIWRSNTYGMKAELNSIGITDDKIKIFHIEDNKKIIFQKLESILSEFDVIILSGGVSMGKFDYVPSVLSDLGVTIQFHKIKQKPGKPMLFGTLGTTLGTTNKKCIFGLPGNPVSALICMRRYVITSLANSMGLELNLNPIQAELSEDVTFKKDFTLFKAVELKVDNLGKRVVTPTDSNGSGDFSSLAKSDGFIELPECKTHFKEGEIYSFYPWSSGGLL